MRKKMVSSNPKRYWRKVSFWRKKLPNLIMVRKRIKFEIRIKPTHNHR